MSVTDVILRTDYRWLRTASIHSLEALGYESISDGEINIEPLKRRCSMGIPIVLCIDDRPEQLELRKPALEASGFSVETATNGYAAIKRLGRVGGCGLLIQRGRHGRRSPCVSDQPKFPSLPIILLSAYVDMPERILWLVDDDMMKSELPDGLFGVIERVTRRTNTDETHTLAPARMNRARIEEYHLK